jgi:hypothetical protein
MAGCVLDPAAQFVMLALLARNLGYKVSINDRTEVTSTCAAAKPQIRINRRKRPPP